MTADVRHCRRVLAAALEELRARRSPLPAGTAEPDRGRLRVVPPLRRRGRLLAARASAARILQGLRRELARSTTVRLRPVSRPRASRPSRASAAIPRRISRRAARRHGDGRRGRQLRHARRAARYSFRVAGTVGLMMCHVVGATRPRALVHAAHLGIAMQLTNICRDVPRTGSRDVSTSRRRCCPPGWGPRSRRSAEGRCQRQRVRRWRTPCGGCSPSPKRTTAPRIAASPTSIPAAVSVSAPRV